MPARSSRPRPTAAEFVAQVRSRIGRPYVWGGTGPFGYDCSGLVFTSARAAGIRNCPRTSQEQWLWCEHVNTAQAGDLVFFTGALAEKEAPPGHVGVVVAPGVMIDAPTTGQNVQQVNFGTSGTGESFFWGYGRMPGLASSTANQSLITTRNRSGPGSADSTTAQAAALIGSVFIVVILIALAAGVLLILAAGMRYTA